MIVVGGSGYALAASGLPEGFVYLRDADPTIVQEMRYHGSHNFLGRPVAGYEAPECILTARAANALASVQDRLRPRGLSLKVYDCYRPERAVRDFVRWAGRPGDDATRGEFYPTIDKSELFARRYIAKRSAHSRGSTVDLAIVPLPPRPQPTYRPGDPLKPCHGKAHERFPDNSLDFGTGFDCFHELSHTRNPAITGEARDNRMLLLTEMERPGFTNYRREWWHFELKNEPFPKTFFDFPIRPRRQDAAAAPDASRAPGAGGGQLQIVCRPSDRPLAARDMPSLGGVAIAELPAGTATVRSRHCDGKFDLAAWHDLDAIGQLAEAVHVPWCLVELPGGPPAEPPKVGWIEGRYLAPPGRSVDCP